MSLNDKINMNYTFSSRQTVSKLQGEVFLRLISFLAALCLQQNLGLGNVRSKVKMKYFGFIFLRKSIFIFPEIACKNVQKNMEVIILKIVFKCRRPRLLLFGLGRISNF